MQDRRKCEALQKIRYFIMAASGLEQNSIGRRGWRGKCGVNQRELSRSLNFKWRTMGNH